MSRPWHRLLQIIIGYPNPWEEHVENVAMGFYCRGLAQNVTMVGFLGKFFIFIFHGCTLWERLMSGYRMVIDTPLWPQLPWDSSFFMFRRSTETENILIIRAVPLFPIPPYPRRSIYFSNDLYRFMRHLGMSIFWNFSHCSKGDRKADRSFIPFARAPN